MTLKAPFIPLLVIAIPAASLAQTGNTVRICAADGSERRVPAPDSERPPPCAHWCDTRRREHG